MISIVIASISDERFGGISAQYAAALGTEPYEIIRISDATGLCEGYNRGLDRSRGEVVIFSHDDIELMEPGVFLATLRRHLERVDVVGPAGTTRLAGPAWASAMAPYVHGQVLHPYHPQFVLSCFGVSRPLVTGAQALDGLFLAFKRPCIEAIRWDAETFDGFHLYDVDATFRAYLAGYRLGVACNLRMYHASGGNFDQVWKKYADRFVQKYGPRLAVADTGPGQFCVVATRTREEAFAAMYPPHWSQLPAGG